MRDTSYRNGDVIIAEDNRTTDAYVLHRGSVEVYLKGPPERRLFVLRPVTVFGEMALVTDKPRSASVRALEHVEVTVFDRDEYMAIWRAYPETAVEVIRILCERIRALTSLVGEFCRPDFLLALEGMAEVWAAQGHYDRAEPYLKRVIALLERVLGPDHPDVSTALKKYAVLLRRMKRAAAAEAGSSSSERGYT